MKRKEQNTGTGAKHKDERITGAKGNREELRFIRGTEVRRA